MDCPICNNVKLAVTERQGIEIDYCPQCRGVWLDRGELDKIIDRSASYAPAAQPEHHAAASYPSYQAQPDRSHAHRDAYHHGGQGHYKKKKREGFLSDLFDFD